MPAPYFLETIIDFLQLPILRCKRNLIAVEILEHILQSQVDLDACRRSVFGRFEWASNLLVDEAYEFRSTHARAYLVLTGCAGFEV